MSNRLKIVSIVSDKSDGPRSGTFAVNRTPTVDIAKMPEVAPYILSMEGTLLTIKSSHQDIDKSALQRIEDRIEEAERELEKGTKDAAFERERGIKQLADNTGLPIT